MTTPSSNTPAASTQAVPADAIPSAAQTARWMFDPKIVKPALADSFRKLSPRVQWRNPVMFVVYLGSILTTLLFIQAITGKGEAPAGFIFAVAAWLWFTVLFANFAEALAEGRSKAQAAALRGVKKSVMAKKLRSSDQTRGGVAAAAAQCEVVEGGSLRKGDLVLIEAGDTVPADGDVIEGVATVDESAITGESAPVIRESGGDFSAVTGGTRVLSDWIVVRVSVNPGEAFLDRMIAMVEGARRQKTPNELALTLLLVALTLVFLLVTVTLLPFSIFSVTAAGAGSPVTVTALIALLVCLIPTTIGGLLSAIGVAGMSRMMQANVIATSGRAVEAAGDVDVLLLDKTGTITLGNRQAAAFMPAPGVAERELADVAQLASLADETPEGRSIVVLAKNRFNLREREMANLGAEFIPFSAQTRVSGIDIGNRRIRKGAADAIRKLVRSADQRLPAQVESDVEAIARRGGTPLVVIEWNNEAAVINQGAPIRILGTVELKDIVKGGIKERFGELRRMGIKTIMITGDNRLTAAAIAAEAGVDDFLAEATPEQKLALIRQHQAEGKLVAMTGDGTNDAPALAQADVAVAMNSGTQAAKEAGNMVDLDSNPTKLIEIVEIGKQMLMTRGSLTTFSIANDVAKYFAIIPAMFVANYPQLGALNVMRLTSPDSAIMSAVIFNALVIVGLIPLALRGVRYRALGAAVLLRRNLLIYGVGGLLVPFVGIKLIDLLLTAFGLV
ncbi:potassium-transporting ATPase subunit KdpB [Herbaspirillum huttiense]|uniref:Potassium-transporting ATPase ATP-binding subunit n=3 Tax=Herbaspirillum huttiense TaxID=863372 RepID=A0AAJ2H623_9BURK|nr:potassium-transporting ATPase subunit KdpB [Herbaspirillum huttiense]MDR9837487.1 potassium-transporting ATPase subunit KdpB [Herbaspirillum huttiense]MDR9848574.1 potassium-transporting ATPase subunit KdpB [Herbaspirillum huttiense SE1]